ncbi:unnamed protein product, partial [Hapterophycus canaliculatus]
MRGQFWEVVQRLSATLPDPDPMNQADAFPGDPLGRRRPLKEHVELRGFLPLADLYKKRYAMDGPAVPAVPDDCAGSVRIRGLKAFATAVSGEPLAPMPAPGDVLQYGEGPVGLMMMAGAGGGGGGGGGAGSTSSHHRENRSEYSESSSGSHSHSHHLHDSGRPFELALRPSGPSSQHSSHRAPPGMSGGGGGGMAGPGGERTSRSFSGSGPIVAGGGYFGSGSSLGAASEGDAWRASKGAGPGAGLKHSRNASVSVFRGTSHQQQHHHQFPSQVPHTRQHSQPMMPSVGGGGSDLDPSGGGQYFHPPLHRVHSQAAGVTATVAPPGGTPSSSTRGMFNSSGRHSETASVTGSRHSLDSGMRYYEGRHGPIAGAPGSYNPAGGNPAPSTISSSSAAAVQSSVGATQGSGSGSSGSGVGSAFGSGQDTHSFGAWSAPGGR